MCLTTFVYGEDQSIADLINQNIGSAQGGERGNKRPIEGHSRSCRPAQVKVTGGTGKRRILKTEEGTPAEDGKIGHFVCC